MHIPWPRFLRGPHVIGPSAADAGSPTALRRRWQFSVAGLLTLVLLLSVPLWQAHRWLEQKQRERDAVKALKQLGAHIQYGSEKRNGEQEWTGPAWLRRLFGDDVLTWVVSVNMSAGKYRPEFDGSLFGSLPELRKLLIWDSDLSEAQLRSLSRLSRLENLDLLNSPVSDAGARELAKLTHLRWLSLNGSKQLTDRGVACLAALSELRSLDLRETQVTDEGLEFVARLRSLRRLCLGPGAISDAGLSKLAQLHELECLALEFTNVTNDGLRLLPHFDKLSEVAVWGYEITDESTHAFQQIARLRDLDITATGISKSGARSLRKALPKCILRCRWDYDELR